jgi:DNA-nicking Smr family endonuclease
VTGRIRRRRKPAQAKDAAAPPAPRRETQRPKPASTQAPKQAIAAPQDRGGEKRIRRGKLEIGATLDLHGHTQDAARAALRRFLRAAHARGERTVIVVTGVGRANEGVLKRRLPEWLAEADLRQIVSGFAQAHRAHGGAGAVYVFLRRPAATHG